MLCKISSGSEAGAPSISEASVSSIRGVYDGIPRLPNGLPTGDAPGLPPSPSGSLILPSPTNPLQPYPPSAISDNPPNSSRELSDFGEHDPYSQSRAHTPVQRTRVSSSEQSLPTAFNTPNPHTSLLPQWGVTSDHQPGLLVEREPHRTPPTGESGNGSLQPPDGPTTGGALEPPPPPYTLSASPTEPPRNLHDLEDSGEYNPHSQFQTYTAVEHIPLSPFDEPLPARPTRSGSVTMSPSPPGPPGRARDTPGLPSSSSTSSVRTTPARQLTRGLTVTEEQIELHRDTSDAQDAHRYVVVCPPLLRQDLDRFSPAYLTRRPSGVYWSVMFVAGIVHLDMKYCS